MEVFGAIDSGLVGLHIQDELSAELLLMLRTASPQPGRFLRC